MKKLNLIKKTGCCSSTIDINEDDIAVDFFDAIVDCNLRRASATQIGIRSGYEFEGKALWLDCDYDWIVGKDTNGNTILVPLKKDRKTKTDPWDCYINKNK